MIKTGKESATAAIAKALCQRGTRGSTSGHYGEEPWGIHAERVSRRPI